MSASTPIKVNIAEYFGTTERPIISHVYLAYGWTPGSQQPVTREALLDIARHGGQKVSLKLGTRIADFTIGELAPVGIFTGDPLEGLR